MCYKLFITISFLSWHALVLVSCSNESSYVQTTNKHETSAESINQTVTDSKTMLQDYINSLPKTKRLAYEEAHIHWDTGITTKMYAGNNVLNERLMHILVTLSTQIYPIKHFKGLHPHEFYQETVDELFNDEIKKKSTSENGGTLQGFLLHAEKSTIIDTLIINAVKASTPEDYFKKWKIEWESASR